MVCLIEVIKLRSIIAEALSEDRERNSDIKKLLKQYPFMKGIESQLRYSTAALITMGSLPAKDMKRAFETLSSDPLAKKHWSVRLHRDSKEFILTSTEEQERLSGEQRRAEKLEKKHADVKLDIKTLKTKPVTSFTKKQLYDAAKATGERLFGSHQTGLIWSADSASDVEFQRISTYDMIDKNDMIDNLGRDAFDEKTYFSVETFEFVFFPSRPGQGIDASDRLCFVNPAHIKKMADTDGNIYTAGGDYITMIRIIKPTMLDVKTYRAAIAKKLQKH